MLVVAVPCVSEGATRTVPGDFATIQAAIDASGAGDSVLVAPGTYTGPGNRGIEFRGRDLVLLSAAGPDATILDCEQQDRGFYLHESETRAARVEGFTVVNGNGDFSPIHGDGGGIAIWGSSPTFVRCAVLSCLAREGGGAYLVVADARFESCVFAGNIGTSFAGGFYNTVGFGVTELHDCVFVGNSVTGYGEGGGIAKGFGVMNLVGCTITGNWAPRGGGGIYGGDGLTLDRCIVWGNCSTSESRREIAAGSSDYFTLSCCDVDSSGVRGLPEYDDCVFSDPVFCGDPPCPAAATADVTLHESSPCTAANSPCGQLIGARDVGCYPPAIGACCLLDHSCIETTQGACDAAQGTYLGDGEVCAPDSCLPTAVEERSWGRIKALYRTKGRGR